MHSNGIFHLENLENAFLAIVLVRVKGWWVPNYMYQYIAGSGICHSIKFRFSQQLNMLANGAGLSVDSAEFAAWMDERDPLGKFRLRFQYPKLKDLSTVGESLVVGTVLLLL